MPHSKNSLRNFPPDMLVLSGFPIVGIGLVASALFPFFMRPEYVTIGALLMATLGACLLLWTKLPLYQKHIFLSFGPSAVTESRRGFYYWGIGLALGGCTVAAMLVPFCGR